MTTFVASQFESTKYDTAEKKAKAANALFAFLEVGCPQHRFTKAVYDALYLHAFGHIAHYSAEGFYGTWFSTSQQRAEWIEYALKGGWLGLHSPDGTQGWGDWERAVQSEIRSRGYDTSFRSLADEDVEAGEVAEFLRLSAKYGEAAR